MARNGRGAGACVWGRQLASRVQGCMGCKAAGCTNLVLMAAWGYRACLPLRRNGQDSTCCVAVPHYLRLPPTPLPAWLVPLLPSSRLPRRRARAAVAAAYGRPGRAAGPVPERDGGRGCRTDGGGGGGRGARVWAAGCVGRFQGGNASRWSALTGRRVGWWAASEVGWFAWPAPEAAVPRALWAVGYGAP